MEKINTDYNNETEKFRLNFSRRSKPDATPLKKETDYQLACNGPNGENNEVFFWA